MFLMASFCSGDAPARIRPREEAPAQVIASLFHPPVAGDSIAADVLERSEAIVQTRPQFEGDARIIICG